LRIRKDVWLRIHLVRTTKQEHTRPGLRKY